MIEFSAKWSMAAIDDSAGGVGNFERVAQNVQWAVINKDASIRGDRIGGGWKSSWMETVASDS